MSKIIATAYGLSHPKISNAGDSFSNIDMYKSDGIFNMINDDTLDSHLALLVDDDKLVPGKRNRTLQPYYLKDDSSVAETE